jgi:hypothetical protein
MGVEGGGIRLEKDARDLGRDTLGAVLVHSRTWEHS